MTAEELQKLVAQFKTLDRSDLEWIKAFEILDQLGLIKMKVNQIFYVCTVIKKGL
jgi:hypothetical protein